ncbi:probable LRR receptor-like serine/threonine-protein kinase At1g06840 isoform X2 [Salvia splendens]|uniref:probable LRR receptor-like serine/threonine-protein kinase At1g06840 isoform X2 n=1 Tax=Salvia splendens TaxID=180675 RepID=UPI001C275702|nr:probable LRR receptor-like serine/threonine-protein kinase At1g06840 isoform X2 [Salvia splendens]
MDVDFEEENLRSLQIEEDEGPIRPSSRIRRRIRIESEVSRPNTAQLADTPRIRIDGVSVAYRYRIRIRYVIRQQGGVSVLYRLDFMWNNISGIIPKEIGNITSLELLLLSGNQLIGSLPEELGKLSNLNRIQVDENQISGPIPLSFSYLSKAKHIHMNNNSLSGPIPPELSRLSVLVHLLLDNNNLSGRLPPELSELTHLLILQLDNNNFSGSTIPSSYGNMTLLLKLSLSNCSLYGDIPNWSNMLNVAYIDLSLNQLNGSIPTGALSRNITVIDLSNNTLNGIVPGSFSELPLLQKLSLANNLLSGSVPSSIWQNRILNASERLILDFTNNRLSNISGSLLTAPNITIGLQGNPLCSNRTLIQFCGPNEEHPSNLINITRVNGCSPQLCKPPYEYAPASPGMPCFCAAPLHVGYRLKSPGFYDFVPYLSDFEEELSSGLGLNIHQLAINSAIWQKGPRLRMYLKIFPPHRNNSMQLVNDSEVLRIRDLFSGWRIKDNHVFGPFEFLNFTLSDAYADFLPPSSSGISKGALAGIILGTIAGSVVLSAFVSLLILRRRIHKHHQLSSKRLLSRSSIKIDGVKDFTYSEMAQATNNFDSSSVVGQGGYGKVYRGVLADGKVVAVKRAQEGSLQGEKEFLTEIELLSRLHHRNLVSLSGYCDDQGEQMLAYEFVPNGTLRDNLSGKFKVPLNFAMRVRTALDAARGILYLHTEANPPIFHRDIKSSNILMDSKYSAKVADFGLSKLAPVSEFDGNAPSHISTVVKGTPGYLDPEYFLTHKLTDKSDVYSLGVVFLELLTGMHPIYHGKNIVREVNIAYNSGIVFSVIDERMGSYPSECVQKFVNLALKCCKDDPDERPSMAQVVRELDNIWMMMPDKDSEISEYPAKEVMGSPVSSSRVSYPGKEAMSSLTSSSIVTASYGSVNVSGSDLISGAIPGVAPR